MVSSADTDPTAARHASSAKAAAGPGRPMVCVSINTVLDQPHQASECCKLSDGCRTGWMRHFTQSPFQRLLVMCRNKQISLWASASLAYGWYGCKENPVTGKEVGCCSWSFPAFQEPSRHGFDRTRPRALLNASSAFSCVTPTHSANP